jgi:hypothetical protein
LLFALIIPDCVKFSRPRKNLDLSLIPSNLFTKEAVQATTEKTEIENTSSMTKGGMGVAISQRWIYEKVLYGIEDYVLIIEDDITITDNFMENLEKTIKKIPEFDILWIGYHNKNNHWISDVQDTGLDIPEKIWGLFGYIINKKAAKRLIEIFPISSQLDTEIPQVFPDLKVYAVNETEKLILSDESQDAVRFGTDIQFDREPFQNIIEGFKNIYNFTNDKLMVCVICIVIIFCFIFYYNI